MRPLLRTATGLLLACAAVGASQAQPVPAAPTPASPPPAAPAVEQPCGARAARYESGKGFDLVVTRVGQIRVENPLRPLTPEVNRVLQVVIAGKVATAYGTDFGLLRRGGSPAAVEAMLGGPVRWEAALPILPASIAIVAEDGLPLADLSFRTCADAPQIKAASKSQSQARKKPPASGRPKIDAGAKAPPGFSLPQGAIAE